LISFLSAEECCALYQMRAMMSRKRTREVKSNLRVSVVRLVLSVSSIVLIGKF